MARRTREVKEKFSVAAEKLEYVIPNHEQKELVRSINHNSISLVLGPAGGGKTLFSIQTLYQMYKRGEINAIYIVRLILESKYENIGALPGTEVDKFMPYLLPIIDNLELFVPKGEIEYLISNKVIQVIPMSYIRGRTFTNKGIIIEESQNLNEHEIVSIATRIGDNSKMIFNGDDKQSDLEGRRGIGYLLRLFEGIDDIGIVRFSDDMIMRHPVIQSILERQKELRINNYL